MNWRWTHPATVLMGLSATMLFVIFGIEGLYGMINSLMEIQGSPGWELFRKDWPRIIAGWVWLSAFSVGVVGLLIYGSLFLRCGISMTKDFSPLGQLSRTEVQELETWFRDGSYGPEHLKEIWGKFDRG